MSFFHLCHSETEYEGILDSPTRSNTVKAKLRNKMLPQSAKQLTDQQLKARLNAGESESTEFTQSPTNKDKIGKAGRLPADMEGVLNATIEEDLDIEYFKNHYLPSAISREVLIANQRDKTEQMRSLRLLNHQQLPTVLAILITGKHPRHWFPGAYIQFVRFEGDQVTDPVKNQQEISGILPEQIRQIEEVLKTNIARGLRLSDTKHIETPDYPFSALSQLIRNAVMHRDYNSHSPVRVHWFHNRIEIQSPGGPYGELNITNFGTQGLVSYRNPSVAEALKYLGFVERFGFGLPQARKALQDNNHPDLELIAQPSFVLAVVQKRKDL